MSMTLGDSAAAWSDVIPYNTFHVSQILNPPQDVTADLMSMTLDDSAETLTHNLDGKKALEEKEKPQLQVRN